VVQSEDPEFILQYQKKKKNCEQNEWMN
jgi:hypothetical protein